MVLEPGVGVPLDVVPENLVTVEVVVGWGCELFGRS